MKKDCKLLFGMIVHHCKTTLFCLAAVYVKTKYFVLSKLVAGSEGSPKKLQKLQEGCS
jgi:hypothetical protein